MMKVITLSLPLANRDQLHFAFNISMLNYFWHGSSSRQGFSSQSRKIVAFFRHGKQGRTKTRSQEAEKEETSGRGAERLPPGEGTAEADAVTTEPEPLI
jgi:hypothetical protein